MKGSAKRLAIVLFLVVFIGLVPMIAFPLSYRGLDWLSYGGGLYYGDMYEPDDSRQEASYYNVYSLSQLHNFHAPGNSDWVWFYGQAGMTYVLQTHAISLGSDADTVIDLYNYAGERLGGDDDSGYGSDALYEFEASYTGLHYVRVTEYWGEYGESYWYLLSIKARHIVYFPVLLKGN